jgi:DNA-binding transcriptional LysR family regulator
VSGHLMLACSTAAGKYILPRLMGRFLEHHPNVNITCDVGRRGMALDRLGAGEIDLAVSSLRIPRRAIEYRHLTDDLLALIVPAGHPWAEVDALPPEHLIDYPIILREPGSGTAITVNRGLAQFDMSIDMLETRLVIGNTESIVQAVAEGLGPAFVSRLSAEGVIRQGLVAEVKVAGLQLVQRLYMARHTGFNAPEVQTAFWNFTFAPENQALRQILTS